MSGAKRKLERKKLRAEGRLKHSGKGKCKVCKQFGCSCPGMSDKDLNALVDANTIVEMIEPIVLLTAAFAARRHKKMKEQEEERLYIRPNEGSS